MIERKCIGFITKISNKRTTKMAYIAPQKVTPQQVLTFIRQFNKRYNQFPLPRQIAEFFGVVPQTIYVKLNILEKEGKLDRIKVKKHSTSYTLKG